MYTENTKSVHSVHGVHLRAIVWNMSRVGAHSAHYQAILAQNGAIFYEHTFGHEIHTKCNKFAQLILFTKKCAQAF